MLVCEREFSYRRCYHASVLIMFGLRTTTGLLLDKSINGTNQMVDSAGFRGDLRNSFSKNSSGMRALSRLPGTKLVPYT